MSLIPRKSLFDINDLFDDFYPPMRSSAGESLFSPRVDVTEKDDRYEIVADLPGVDKKDMSVTLDHGVLKIEASTTTKKSEKDDGQIIRQERFTGKYSRSFTLGNDIHEEDIQADFKDGVLTLKIPKAKESPRERKVINVE
ncbi:MAG: Hsp20/alpha crystallin family protein [Pseudomonadales bacterium]|nr:Hsp20/alpha crystallin family protein [Gammaproteobacteria bacterium]NNL57490.1 Hsp20/alpha crystallin family protein [Pseudomonadales bacterium]